MNTEETDAASQRQFKTARRRSLSGSSVPAKAINRKVNFGFRTNKLHLNKSANHKVYDSTDTILSELDNMEQSIDSLSSSSGINVSDSYRKSNTAPYSDGHRRKCHSVSAKEKIKHFLSEHIVKTHPCHHPEYHFHKKDSSNNISIYDSKNKDLNESDFQEYSSQESSDASSPNEVPNNRPKSAHEINNSMNMTSSILDRIRNINIQPFSPSIKSEVNIAVTRDQNTPREADPRPVIIIESHSNFPFPEPNPYKLPKVLSPSSIDFSPKQILTNKNKRQRLAHSLSCDPDYTMMDNYKSSNMRSMNHMMAFGPEYIPEKDKWEKKISGYLDTSTPTGATLTAINFGLKRVTETDKYLMITKSPTSCPNDFLEDGISHIQATGAIYQSLMRHSTCYDVMPDSGKVIIIDSQMQIGRAFDAIEDNIVRASPIWSSQKQDFVALLTVNDLVPLLLHMHQTQNGEDHCCEDDGALEDFSTITVEKCLSVIPRLRSLQNHLIGVTPETNLHAVNVMFNHFHRSMVLVIDSVLSGNPLFLLTSLRTLTYLFYKAYTVSLESCFLMDIQSSTLLQEQNFEVLQPLSTSESPCQSLCISSPGKSHFMIHVSSSIVDVLRAMAKSYYCCAMIIESNTDCAETSFVVIDVITMADILNLVKVQKHRDLSVTAADILQYRERNNEPLTYRDPVVSCCVNDSVHHLINVIVKEKASFVLVRSANDIRSVTLGILTAHDILGYIDSLPCQNIDMPSDGHGMAKYQFGKFEKCKKNNTKYNSENRYVPTILDDSGEDIFDIGFS